ncbi:MarR family transcriptional regulator [Microbacterium sp. KSW4-17]|uniref:MarR family transcriptional regulator n=1 Tax=Microbacterium galbum TaxID=3075994 RepID=A0ABU3T5R8_9MICO|nr:MarR family transcriptional regulator [Microbacterium sp. KSW4-17]MDU0366715.1 MarR family transcriptional regulator [Microbacterium sp. KSW4-17]
MTGSDALSTSWSTDEVAVMHGLRDWSLASEELHRHLSAWMALPVTDADALGRIVWAEQSGHPLSPAELARQIGMTSGAVSVLIDRLERAGHVERHRGDADRRRVNLRPTSAARAGTADFLDAAGTEIAAAVRDTPAEELRVVRAFLDRMTSASGAANTRLRAG